VSAGVRECPLDTRVRRKSSRDSTLPALQDRIEHGS